MDEHPRDRQIHVKVCEEAWQCINALATSNGVTITSLLDAVGHFLSNGDPARGNGVFMPERIKAAVQFAREIDAGRRRRSE